MNSAARQYWLLVAGLAAVELASWGVYHNHVLGVVTFWILVAGGLVLGLRRLDLLAYATLAELVLGSKGYLFFWHTGTTTISIRIGLFVVLGLAAVWQTVYRRQYRSWPRKIFLPIIPILSWVVIEVVAGMWHHRALSAIYQDANAYLYLVIAWFWVVAWRGRTSWRANGLTVILAATTLIGIKSWLMMVLFGHNIPGLLTVYHWIRDTGVGEVALIGNQTYRVFFQSQIYCLFGFLLVFGGFMTQRVPRWWVWPMLWSAVGLYISLSRSFLIGLVIGLLVMAVYALHIRKISWLRRAWVLVPLALWAWLMMSWAINFPAVINPYGLNNGLSSRLNDVGFSQASTARFNQIKPLWRAITTQPIFGSGFGATATYFSTDPRVHDWRTTFAFELGYLDMWLKLGVIGLGLFGWWLWTIWQRLRRHEHAILFVGSFVALLGVHLTSPYLNHPLGLGWLVFLSLYSYDQI